MNGRAVLITLLIASAFNWDSLITRYNLQRENPDIYHMTSLLGNNLIPLLDAAQRSTVLDDTGDKGHIERRGEQLERRAAQRDWRSWNWSTYRQLQAWKAYQEAQ